MSGNPHKSRGDPLGVTRSNIYLCPTCSVRNLEPYLVFGDKAWRHHCTLRHHGLDAAAGDRLIAGAEVWLNGS